jgi:hypothetical protein
MLFILYGFGREARKLDFKKLNPELYPELPPEQSLGSLV